MQGKLFFTSCLRLRLIPNKFRYSAAGFKGIARQINPLGILLAALFRSSNNQEKCVWYAVSPWYTGMFGSEISLQLLGTEPLSLSIYMQQ